MGMKNTRSAVVDPPRNPEAAALGGARCAVENFPNGEMVVRMRLDRETSARLRSRAQTMPMGEYLWENLLKQAISTHVF